MEETYLVNEHEPCVLRATSWEATLSSLCPFPLHDKFLLTLSSLHKLIYKKRRLTGFNGGGPSSIHEKSLFGISESDVGVW